MNLIQSNAYNFAEHFNSGVDPRTGMFQASINMGGFNSHDGIGNTIPLSIHYNENNEEDCGVGRGWSFIYSRYDKARQWLALSSGQSFKIEWDPSSEEFKVPYRKLKDIRITINKETEDLIVYFKDGTEEHINIEEGVISKIVSVQGLETYYEFKNANNRNYLTEIIDNLGRKVTINWYDDKYKTKVIHSFKNVIFQTFILDKKGKDLILGRFCTEGQNSYTYFEYKKMADSRALLINKITHPTGLTEDILYTNRHSTPNGSPLKKMPAVNLHILDSGEKQERKITKYHYSDRNYLGFGSDRRWIMGEDTLFKAKSNYRYQSEEIINDSKIIKRMYNKYHLLVKEEYLSERSLIKEIYYTYYCNEHMSIEEQSAQYSLLKEQKTIHYNSNGYSSTMIVTFEYDEYANLTKCIQADKTQIIKIYYPVEGETSLCPPQDNLIVSLLKSETFIVSDNNEPVRVTNNTYKKIELLNHLNKNLIVLDTQFNHKEKNTFHYAESKYNHFIHGRLIEARNYINNTLVNTVKYNHTKETNTIKNTTTTIFENVENQTGNKLTISFIEIYCRNKFHLISLTDPENNQTKYNYDILGRLISTKYNLGTSYEQSNSINYEEKTNGIHMTYTNEFGHISKLESNAAGNVIREFIQSSKLATPYLRQEYEYNAFGLLVKKIEHDSDKITDVTLETIITYDDQQTIKQIQHPDGRIERYFNDLANKKLTYIQNELLKEESTFNDAGLVLEKKTYSYNIKNTDQDWELIASTSYQYDGFGNITQTTDTSGHIIQFKHDDLDRIISSKRTIDNVDIIESFEYPIHTIEAQPSKIFLNNKLIGSREYDSLMRITAEFQSGFKTSYIYDGISSRELKITSARNETLQDVINFTYDSIIKQPKTRTTEPAQNIDATYQYDNKNRLVIEENPSCKSTFIFNDDQDFGRLVEERILINGRNEEIIKTSYSKSGNIISHSDNNGYKKTLTYDKFNRIENICELYKGKSISSEIEYDKFSRAVKYITTEMETIGDLNKTILNVSSIELELNALGAEVSRVLKINNSHVYTIVQEYNIEQLLTKKTYTSENSSTIENYIYDTLHRLKEYTCTGPKFPEDESGKNINKQIFTHDIYGNITKIETNYTDGSENVSTFSFIQENPCLLGRVINSNSSAFSDFECKYDGIGNLSNDERGNIYAHNVLGQLDTVFTAKNEYLTSYEYAPNGKLVSQKYSDGSRSFNHYINGNLVKETCDVLNTEIQSCFNPGGFSSQIFHDNSTSKTEFLLGDAQESILKTINMTDQTEINETYTCFGESKKNKIL